MVRECGELQKKMASFKRGLLCGDVEMTSKTVLSGFS